LLIKFPSSECIGEENNLLLNGDSCLYFLNDLFHRFCPEDTAEHLSRWTEFTIQRTTSRGLYVDNSYLNIFGSLRCDNKGCQGWATELTSQGINPVRSWGLCFIPLCLDEIYFHIFLIMLYVYRNRNSLFGDSI